MLFGSGIYTLVHAVLGFVIAIALLRFYLQKFRASVHNPIGRFVMAVSNPLIIPLRRFIPGWKGQDLSSLLVAFAAGSMLAVIEVQLFFRGSPSAFSLMWIGLVGGLYNMVMFSAQIFIWLLIANAVLSWVNQHHWAYYLTGQMTEFIRRPVANLVPPVSGIDLSTLILVLALQFLVVVPLERGWVIFLFRLLQ